MEPRLLVIQHNLDDGLNELAPSLVTAGLHIDTWCTFLDDHSPWELRDFSGVLSLGALASATDEESVPWIHNEIALLRTAIAQGLPTLGVCFGAQALACAAGGRARPAAAPEIGWYNIAMSTDAEDDPLLGSLEANFPAFQYHHDTFDLPPEATVLGMTGDLIEAYRIGDSAWGVQFHIEANPSVVYGWLGAYHDDMITSGVDVDELRAATTRNWIDYRARSEQVGAAFAEQVKQFATAGQPLGTAAAHTLI